MRTIAVSIDEPTLAALDRFLDRESAGSNRSALVRRALRDFLRREESRAAEEEERRIWRRHREMLERQASALIEEQAMR